MHLKVYNAIIYTKLIITSLVFSYDGFDREVFVTKNVELEVKNFAADFEIPWGMAFLPDTSMLVTDLSGSLYRVYQDGDKDAIEGMPNVYYKGQGGLLDVEVHPDFSENNYIYVSYSQPKKGKAFTAVARSKLIRNQLEDFEIIYSTEYKHYSRKTVHFGSRFAISGDYLFFSIGDRGERDEAQDLDKPNGKIHRLHLDEESLAITHSNRKMGTLVLFGVMEIEILRDWPFRRKGFYGSPSTAQEGEMN